MTTTIENPALTGLGPLRPTRAGAKDFPPVAKAYIQVSQIARESGLLNRAPKFYVLAAVGIALALGGAVLGSVLIGDSWYQLLIAAALAVIFTQIAFLAHEAAHRVILNSGPANDRLALVLAGLIGMSYTWWDSKHSRHHANPNRVGKDPDIEIDTISFVEEDAAKSRGLIRAITKHQGWLFFPLLTLEGLNLHMHSFVHLFSREPVKWRWTQLAIITFRFAALLVPVFAFLPLGLAFAFLGVQFAVFGVYMGASFAPNHKGMPIVAHDAKLDFFSKQVRTSRNIKGGWWATTLMGGLNYQVEHHLFPSMARPHLSKASKIVKEFCATHNVPYTEASLIESYSIVIQYLNRVGLAARDPFDCPIAAQHGRSR
ncbi:fatty acid desaturase family protein [Leucobacter aridicollis]|uniref:fatty acid desaturase family protein n=1 Tax=Leucobacter aridicollis TaxID=283878 RepID=UPI002169B92A|nr:acyl-CoA desaturase [Leucobacter aridicollis]MCS3426728.1 fatty acid desaturase [Leucobacter aridicollis]